MLKNFDEKNIATIAKQFDDCSVSGHELVDDLPEKLTALVDEAYQEGIQHAFEAIKDAKPYVDLDGFIVRVCLLGWELDPEADLQISTTLDDLFKAEHRVLSNSDTYRKELAAKLREYADMFEAGCDGEEDFSSPLPA